jgi:hypothetical protein
MFSDSVIHKDDERLFFNGTSKEVIDFLESLNPTLYKYVLVVQGHSLDKKLTVQEYLAI